MKRLIKVLSLLMATALIAGILPISAFAAPATNNSVFISDTIPSEMIAGRTYSVTITVKNTGSATWTSASGYKLKAIGSDPFTSTLSYSLSGKDKIKKNGTKTFTISMTAPSTAGTYATDWRMYKGATAFGPTFTHQVTVVSSTPAYASTGALAHSAITVANGTSKADAIAELDSTVGVVGTNGETGVAAISWSIASYDSSAAGDYMATGVLTLPAGWTGTAAGVSATVTVSAPPAYASTDALRYSTITVPYGTSKAGAIAELVFMNPDVGVVGTNEETDVAAISWSIASYDSSAAGDYTATGVLTLPAGWTGTAADVSATVTVEALPLPVYASTGDLPGSAITVTNGTSKASVIATLAALSPTVGVFGTHGETGVAAISWSIASYDGSVAGLYIATGVLTLPAGWTGTAGDVEAAVRVEEPAVYESKGDLAHRAITVPYGTGQADAIAALDQTVDIFGANCEAGVAAISWTIASYDGSAAGDYTATGVLTLPVGWTGTAEDVIATVTVEVAPGELPATSNWTMDMNIASNMVVPYEVVMNVDGSTISGTIKQTDNTVINTFTGTLSGHTFTGIWVYTPDPQNIGGIEWTFNAAFDRLTGTFWFADNNDDPYDSFTAPITNGMLVP